MIMPILLHFYNMGPKFGLKFAPKTPPTLFFPDFQWNMLGISININNLCYNATFLRKVAKNFQIAILGQKDPTWPENDQIGQPPKSNSFFLHRL